MRVEQETIDDKKDYKSGARIGDQIIFSPYHPHNIGVGVFDYSDITPNKLYTVVELQSDGVGNVAMFLDDVDVENCGFGLHHDVVNSVHAPEPEFAPVHLILETPHEAALLTMLIGSYPISKLAEIIGVLPNQINNYETYVKLKAISDKALPKVDTYYRLSITSSDNTMENN